MDSKEAILLEAVKNMLDDKVKLGLSFHGEPDEKSHTVQFHNEEVRASFRIKANNAKIKHYDSVCQAFNHTYSYLNIDNPKFITAISKQMRALAIPNEEQELVLKYIDEINKETKCEIDGNQFSDYQNGNIPFSHSNESNQGIEVPTNEEQ